jgi:hypothetical protein
MHGWLRHFLANAKNRFLGPNYLSQPALGWLKVGFDVDKHLSLSSSFDYRLAIGYFRGGERRKGRVIGAFVISLWVTVCYSVLCFLYEKSSCVGCPAGQWERTVASILRGATQTPGYVKDLKLVWLGLETLKFSLDLVFWHTKPPV